MGEGRDIGAAGFCSPCVCFGVFLLLWWRVPVSGIAGEGGWRGVWLVQ
jgi:hypothetical protein